MHTAASYPGVAVLPSIILGANVTTVSHENVFRSNYIESTASNADICVQYDTSAIVTDTHVFVISIPNYKYLTGFLKKAILE
ncbi:MULTISPECIES: DUF3172 domain-containing protein [unclassified Nostoc]|nr:DUF3172 domain-containing protein [Nostoc sp. S13]